MHDETTPRGGRRSARSQPTPEEAEQAEALSRAAREAVRQPADPRLERSFAHLGAPAPDDSAATGRLAADRAEVGDRAEPPARPSADSADVTALREELAAWQASAAHLGRRLEIATWVMSALTAIVGLLAVVLIVRAAG